MSGLLLSGPAGGGKSAEARRLLAGASVPTLALDFQSLYAALLLLERDADGRYPERNPAHASYALPAAEYLRRAGITATQERDVFAIVTSSDGDPTRRRDLLESLGPDATELILDPGEQVVRRRLSGPAGLSQQCQQAIDRWYQRV